MNRRITEITITVPGDDEGGGSSGPNGIRRQSQDAVASFIGKREEDYLPRRKRKKPPVKGSINFYDMGYQLQIDGSYSTPDLAVVPPWGDDPDPYIVRDLDQSDYAARDAALLAIPVADWKTRFKKITKGVLSSRYGINVSIGGDAGPIDDFAQWTDKGLVLTQGELDSGISWDGGREQLYFTPLYLFLLEDYKITTLPDPFAPPVTFSPSLEMSIFLPPVFVMSTGNASVTTEHVPGPPITYDIFVNSYLNYFYPIWDRNFWLDPSNENFNRPHQAAWSPGFPDDYESAYLSMLLNQGFAYTRSVAVEDDNGVFTVTPGGFPVGPFPPPPALPPSEPFEYPFVNGLETIVAPQNNYLISNTLAAVIQKGSSSYYYFWTV